MSFQNKSFKISFIVGLSFTSIGLIFLLSGLADLGMAFFFFLPLAIGISSGMLPELKDAIAGTLVSLVVFSVFLMVTKIEGVLCVFMATPIILLAVWIGWLIGKANRKNKKDPKLKATLAPLLIFFGANIFEIFTGNPMVHNSVSSSIVLEATPKQVYDNIIEVDTVNVSTNFLQKIGLPIPRKCILTEEKVGGLRLCEFEEGRIVETIKELRKNEYLRMEVTECKLGRDRHWLKFDEDIYKIEAISPTKTKITRTTTYDSNLKPRIYWEYMEGLTIRSEQDFVFRNLKKDISKL